MTLSSGQQAAITAKIRHPRTLVKIGDLGETEVRICSGGNITYNSEVYTKAGVFIDQVKVGKGGVKTCRVHIQNDNHVYTKLAISGAGFSFKPIEVWQFYGTGNPANEDVVKIIDGEIFAIPEMGQKVVFDCATSGAMTRMIPDVTLGPPDLNFMPYAGQTFIFGNESWTVEIN